ncbi:4Fe-4S binding protein [Streptomyces sp. BBFR51]
MSQRCSDCQLCVPSCPSRAPL